MHDDIDSFSAEQPWAVSEGDPKLFYHSIDFPDGTTADGHWDIRGRFDGYIGRYPIAGKTVLDVGTATGFLAFSAEKAGAQVTALDVRGADEIRYIPFKDSRYYVDRAKWIALMDAEHLTPLKKAFWYTWHKFNSNVEVIYAPIDKLYAWDRRFDVVLAGAIIEHISDPISAIGEFARLAKEALIIPFTEVVDTDEESMHPMGDLSKSYLECEWWKLSRGLYRRVFDNLGFDVEFVKCTAVYNPGGTGEVARPTIIARRRPAGSTDAVLPSENLTPITTSQPLEEESNRSARRSTAAWLRLTRATRRALSRLKLRDQSLHSDQD